MKLGRRLAPDAQDKLYPAKLLLPIVQSTRRFRYWQTSIPNRLDQHQTDSCVGHGWAHFLSTAPLTPTYAELDTRVPAAWPERTRGIDPFAAHVYDRAQDLDEFDDTPPSGGTSVRAGAKALQSVGMIGAYHWLSSISEITQSLLELGPVVVGTDWLNSMWDPTPIAPGTGSMLRVDPASGKAGGHCYLLTGVNLDTGHLRMLNSWGTGWGNQGYAYFRFRDFATLLAASGEACMTTDLV